MMKERHQAANESRMPSWIWAMVLTATAPTTAMYGRNSPMRSTLVAASSSLTPSDSGLRAASRTSR